MTENTTARLTGRADAKIGAELDNRNPTATSGQSQQLPKVNTALRYGLRSYRQELLCAELTRDVSRMIDLCDHILDMATNLDRQVPR